MAIRFASFQFSWTAINRWINWVIVAINDGSIADLNVDVLVIISVRRYLIRFLDSKALEGGYHVAAYALQAVTKTFSGPKLQRQTSTVTRLPPSNALLCQKSYPDSGATSTVFNIDALQSTMWPSANKNIENSIWRQVQEQKGSDFGLVRVLIVYRFEVSNQLLR